MGEKGVSELMNAFQSCEYQPINDERDILIADAVYRAVTKKKGWKSPATFDSEIYDYEDLCRELYSKLVIATDAIDYLTAYLLKSSPELLPIKFMEETLREINTLFDLGKEQIGKEGESLSNTTNDKRRKIFHRMLQENKDHFVHLQKSHLPIKCFKWFGGQEIRDFRQKVLQEYVSSLGLNVKVTRNLVKRFLASKSD
jgi:hypothetical protein